MSRFDLAEHEFSIRAQGRKGGRFGHAMAADAGKDDLGGIFQPRRLRFQPRRIEEHGRHGKMRGNRKDRRLLPAAVDRGNSRKRRARDTGRVQRLGC